jgi:phage shock protein C
MMSRLAVTLLAITFWVLIIKLVQKSKRKGETAAPQQQEASTKPKKLARSKRNQLIFGVCGGFAEYFDIDATLVRAMWALASIGSAGSAIFLYALAVMLLPEQNWSDDAGQDSEGQDGT